MSTAFTFSYKKKTLIQSHSNASEKQCAHCHQDIGISFLFNCILQESEGAKQAGKHLICVTYLFKDFEMLQDIHQMVKYSVNTLVRCESSFERKQQI